MPPPPILSSRSSHSSPLPMTMSHSTTFYLPYTQLQPQQLLTFAHTPSLPPPGPQPVSTSWTLAPPSALTSSIPSPLKRLSVVAALVPNLSPLPVHGSSRMKKGEDSDVEMDMAMDGQDHVVDDDGRRKSSPVSSGLNGGRSSRSRSRSGSVSSSVQTLKPLHRDAEVREEGDDEDVDMRSAPASPAPAPRTPIRKSPVVDSSTLPSTLAALDLFSSDEGVVNPPTPRALTPPAPSSIESLEIEREKKEKAEEGGEEDGEDVQMEISPSSIVDPTQAIPKVEKEASEEVEEEAVVKGLQEPAAEKSPVAPPPTSLSPSLDTAQAEPEEVTLPAPEPTPAAPSTPAPLAASSEPQPKPAEQPVQQPEQPPEPAPTPAPAPTQAPAQVKLSLKDFAARRRKMKEDMAQGGMGSPGGALSAGGLPSTSGGGASGVGGGIGLVGTVGVGGGVGLGLVLVGGIAAGAGTGMGRLSPMVGSVGVGVVNGGVEAKGKEKGSEQEKDGVTKMDVKVKETKDGVKTMEDGQHQPQQQPPLKPPSTTSTSPIASTPVMDVRVIEDNKPARENISAKSPTPVRYPPSPPPQRPTSSLSRFDAQAFSAAASAIVNRQHKPPPIPALPPSSPMVAMSSPQLLPSSPPLPGMDLDRDEDESEGEKRDREEEKKDEEERRREEERVAEVKRSEQAKEEEEMKVEKQQPELVVVETRQAKLEIIEPVVPPARATVTPTPTSMPKPKQQPPPPPQLLSRIDTSPHPNVFGVNAHIRRASREDGEIELEVDEVRPSSPVVPSHTPITPQSRFHPPSKFSAAPSLSPTPQAVNPIPLARRLHPPASNNSISRPHRYEPSPPPRSATSASTPTTTSKPKTPPPPPVRANNMWSPPQPPLKTPVVATPGVSVAGPSSLSSNRTGLHPRSPPRGPRSLWNGAASTAGTSTLTNANPSAATPTATATSNGTPLFPENPSGPPTAPRALRQFMKERGQMPGPHPPHHHPHAPH
ncbi:hypothetical protein CPC08DRAFT_273683 [Agrocybe pediades]|nr:hypothetical protein CPC08DRAFT_273683 [Agrocybe pediades]